MTKGKLVLVSLMMATLLPFCSETGTKITAKKNIAKHIKKFMTSEVLEETGFEHFAGVDYFLLLKSKDFYIFNEKDFMIAKFTGNKPQRIFKTREGQAPKEMINPTSFFLYDKDTIAVFDIAKASILLFDLDLNYIKEFKVDSRFGRMNRVGENLVAMLTSIKQENVFAILDSNFNIVNTFVIANQKLPFERFIPRFMNAGYFPGKNLLAHSYWCFPYKKCHVNIHDLNGELVVTLPWEQPFTPNEKTFKEGKGLYGSNYVGKHGSYYAVQCSYSKVLFGPRNYEFMIFDQEGTLKYKGDFPYIILETSNRGIDTKIYFMDDDESISYIDVTDFL